MLRPRVVVDLELPQDDVDELVEDLGPELEDDDQEEEDEEE